MIRLGHFTATRTPEKTLSANHRKCYPIPQPELKILTWYKIQDIKTDVHISVFTGYTSINAVLETKSLELYLITNYPLKMLVTRRD